MINPLKICIDCRGKTSSKKSQRCFSCFVIYNRGENCWQFKGGKPPCSICGEKTTQYNTKVCRACYGLTISGEKNRFWEGGKVQQKIVCECGKTKEVGAKNCQNCYFKKRTGENHPSWIKDRTKLKDDSKERNGQLHREWSRSVKNRDLWKCKIVNSDCKGKLEAHHILGWTKYPELRYQLNNGITLCHAHHPRKRSEEAKLSPYFQKLVAEMN